PPRLPKTHGRLARRWRPAGATSSRPSDAGGPVSSRSATRWLLAREKLASGCSTVHGRLASRCPSACTRSATAPLRAKRDSPTPDFYPLTQDVSLRCRTNRIEPTQLPVTLLSPFLLDTPTTSLGAQAS